LPSATAVFDHRYALPLLVVLPIGAALATRRWLSAGPPPEPGRPAAAAAPTPSNAAVQEPAPPVEGVPA
jgi:hypothetical protein